MCHCVYKVEDLLWSSHNGSHQTQAKICHAPVWLHALDLLAPLEGLVQAGSGSLLHPAPCRHSPPAHLSCQLEARVHQNGCLVCGRAVCAAHSPGVPGRTRPAHPQLHPATPPEAHYQVSTDYGCNNASLVNTCSKRATILVIACYCTS